MKSESLWLGPDTNILLMASQVILIGSQLGEPLIHKNRRLESLELYHTALGWMLGLFPPFLGPGQGTPHWRCLWLCSPKDSLTYPKEREPARGYEPHSCHGQPRKDHDSSSEIKRLWLSSKISLILSSPGGAKSTKGRKKRGMVPPSLPVQIPQAEAWLAVQQFCVAHNWMWD